MQDLIDVLRAAVQRVEIANAEGDPILSAWLPDARVALVSAEARVAILAAWPDKLRKLADWLDLRHGPEEYASDEVQRDLRGLAVILASDRPGTALPELLAACRALADDADYVDMYILASDLRGVRLGSKVNAVRAAIAKMEGK
jgi:hypothetical protein